MGAVGDSYEWTRGYLLRAGHCWDEGMARDKMFSPKSVGLTCSLEFKVEREQYVHCRGKERKRQHKRKGKIKIAIVFSRLS